MQDLGLWGTIVRAKYLKNGFVFYWFCKETNCLKASSNIWKAFTDASMVIKEYIGWKVGNGRQISFDQSLRLNGNFFKPSLNLYISLLQRGVSCLEDVVSFPFSRGVVQKWKSAWDLGLEGVLALEWEDLLKFV